MGEAFIRSSTMSSGTTCGCSSPHVLLSNSELYLQYTCGVLCMCVTACGGRRGCALMMPGQSAGMAPIFMLNSSWPTPATSVESLLGLVVSFSERDTSRRYQAMQACLMMPNGRVQLRSLCGVGVDAVSDMSGV